MGYAFTEGQGRTHASDLVSNEDVSRFKVTFGPANAATLVDTPTPMPVTMPAISVTAPLPARDPANGDPLSVGGLAAAPTSTQQIVAQNLNRKVLEIGNGNAYGIWIRFGSGSAVAGQGEYLPSKATGYWPTTARASCIMEVGATAAGNLIGYTEW